MSLKNSLKSSPPTSFSLRATKRSSLVFIVLMLLPVAACSKSPATVELTGSVTVDGEDVDIGSIAFVPWDLSHDVVAVVITDGRYLATVPIGKSKVEIRMSKITEHDDAPDSTGGALKPVLEEALPGRFNDETTLTVNVTPGLKERNFSLRSERRKSQDEEQE